MLDKPKIYQCCIICFKRSEQRICLSCKDKPQKTQKPLKKFNMYDQEAQKGVFTLHSSRF